MDYQTGPCTPWVTGDDLICDDIDPTILDVAAQAAVDALFNLSGQQFTGKCARVVRPGRHRCDCGFLSCGSSFWVPQWAWSGSLYGGLGYLPFTCCDTSRARLGFPPIVSVELVEVDGDTLDPSEYEVDEFTELVRVDHAGWPTTDTWEVHFTSGVAPPALALLAARTLGCEIAKSIAGVDGCQLPQRVTTLTRQGVSMVFDTMEFLSQGRTGIYVVDLFLQSVNPDNLHSSPTVAVPDQPYQVTRRTFP